MGDITLTDVNKIDAEAVDGLLGIVDSLAYKVHEIEKHFHNFEDFFGIAAAPSGTNKADDILDGTLAPFQIDAGNDAWGAWVQILGADDTPNRASMVKFDLHQLQIVGSESTDVNTFIQIGVGASGAAALSAGNYTTVSYLTPTNLSAENPIDIMMERVAAGELVWARCLAVGANTMTLDFYFGLHEYEG